MLLEREGEHINHKRLRVYRQAGLSVQRNRRKKVARVGLTRQLLTETDQEWSLEFVPDALVNGGSVRVLSIVDNFTRECSCAERRYVLLLDCHLSSRQRHRERGKSKALGTDKPAKL